MKRLGLILLYEGRKNFKAKTKAAEEAISILSLSNVVPEAREMQRLQLQIKKMTTRKDRA